MQLDQTGSNGRTGHDRILESRIVHFDISWTREAEITHVCMYHLLCISGNVISTR